MFCVLTCRMVSRGTVKVKCTVDLKTTQKQNISEAFRIHPLGSVSICKKKQKSLQQWSKYFTLRETD